MPPRVPTLPRTILESGGSGACHGQRTMWLDFGTLWWCRTQDGFLSLINLYFFVLHLDTPEAPVNLTRPQAWNRVEEPEGE